jgi:hypothetical protein
MKSGASLSHIRSGRILNWLVSIGILQLPAVHVKITARALTGHDLSRRRVEILEVMILCLVAVTRGMVTSLIQSV